MGFVGVSTSSSSINKVFPLWADILDLPTRELVGHDVPLDADDGVYRRLVTDIAKDEEHLGALVTTHKIRMYEAAADLFDRLDTFARACGEISSISKENGHLVGHAKDPLTAGLALSDFLPPTHFADTGADALVLGAGGSGTALAWSLGTRPDQPGRVVVTDTSQARLDHLQEVLGRGDRSANVATVLVGSSEETGRVLARCPPGSLVANATGLGKDRPGSPLPDGAAYPRDGYVWEFNYRGSLEFLEQARSSVRANGLTVVDGWRYFIHGWSQVVAEVFHLDLTDADVADLAAAAGRVR